MEAAAEALKETEGYSGEGTPELLTPGSTVGKQPTLSSKYTTMEDIAKNKNFQDKQKKLAAK